MTNGKIGALVALAGVAGLVLCTTGMSLAASSGKAPLRMSVRYDDLDLNRAGDVELLYGRIERAANHVCSPLVRKDLASKAKWSDCRRQAVSAAVLKVGSAKLAEYHASHWRHVA